MKEELIQSEIQKRKIIFYPVTESDLKSLQEKSTQADIYFLITSLCLSSTLATGLTLIINQELNKITTRIIWIILILSIILTVLFTTFTIIQIIQRKKKINELKGIQPDRYTVKELIKQENPEYYVGDQRIIMNIDLERKDVFFKLFQETKQFSLLKTSYHNNTYKVDYFTFTIINGNKNLFIDFQKFLKSNDIKYIDYK